MLLACTATLVACGGGGGGDDDGPPAGAQTLSVTVMDGLVRNATVCIDSNDNLRCDLQEMTSRTDARGVAQFVLPAGVPAASIVAEVGTDATDADTGAVTQAYVMSAPAGQTVVSPLTTLTHRKVKVEGKTLSQAEQEVKTNLGLGAGVSVFANYVEHRDADDGYKKASVLARAAVIAVNAAGTGRSAPGSSTLDHWKEADDTLRTKLRELDDHDDGSEDDNDHGVRTACYTNSRGKVDDDCNSRLVQVIGSPSTPSTPATPAAPAAPGTSGTTSTATGQALYATHCVSCHTSSPAQNVNSVLRGQSAAAILSAIARNKGGMGALAGAISSTEATAIASYLSTF
jgi:cytochrome c553